MISGKIHVPYQLAVIALSLSLFSCQKSWEDRCEEEARRMTMENCPMTILPDQILMDSMTYDRTANMMEYHYRVLNDMDDDSLYIERDSLFREMLQSEVVNSTELATHKRKGVIFRYVYSSTSSGKILFDLKVGPDMY